MPKGGARNRSGPQKDPNSIRSRMAAYSLTALPSGGYDGEIPDLADYLPIVTARHSSIWDRLWSTPQAAAWITEEWRWPIVADLVEYRVRADDPESPASLATSIRQLRDDLGLSPAGLKQNGWAIAHDELAKKRAEKSEDDKPKQQSARDRMKVFDGSGG